MSAPRSLLANAVLLVAAASLCLGAQTRCEKTGATLGERDTRSGFALWRQRMRDVDERGPFPLPLRRERPAGSLVYAGEIEGTLGRVVAAEGFEGGVLGDAWTTNSSDPLGVVELTRVDQRFDAERPSVPLGRFSLRLRTPSGGGSDVESLNEAVWRVDLPDAGDLQLRFATAFFGGTETGLPPEFEGSAPGSGVALSADGVRWVALFSPIRDRVAEWKRYRIDLDAAARDAGIALGPDVLISFQHFGRSFDLVSGGRLYDEISILADDGDEDTFVVQVDPGQTLAAAVEPSGSVSPTLSIAGRGCNGAEAFATQPGEAIRSAPLASRGHFPGRWYVTVGGAPGSLGDYTLRLLLNADFEHELVGAPDNDALARAQALDSAFRTLPMQPPPGRGPAPQRGAVVGTLDASAEPAIAFDDFEGEALDGRWSTSSTSPFGRAFIGTSFRGAATGLTALILETVQRAENLNEAIWSVDLAGVAEALLLFSWARTDASEELPPEFSGSVNGDGVAISDDGVRWHTVFTGEVPLDFDWLHTTIDLAAEAASAGMQLGSEFRIKFQQYNEGNPPDNPFRGIYFDDVRVVRPPQDFYRLHLARGDPLDLAVASAEGGARLELFHAAGAPVAEGLVAANLIENGGFETGDLTGWLAESIGELPFEPWFVGGDGLPASAEFFGFETDPFEGAVRAVNGFSSGVEAPAEFRLSQEVALPANAKPLTLEWRSRIQWNFEFFSFPGGDRHRHRVELRDASTDELLATLHEFETGDAQIDPLGNTGWQALRADLSAFGGRTVRLVFREEVPAPIGPAVFELDDVRLTDRVGLLPPGIDDRIPDFVAPERGDYVARVVGAAGRYTLVGAVDAELELGRFGARARPLRNDGGRLFLLGRVPDPDGTLYGLDESARLYRLDPDRSDGTQLASLSRESSEIVYDRRLDRGLQHVVGPDGFSLESFDIRTGESLGGPVAHALDVGGMEFVGERLYVTTLDGEGMSSLQILDPATGAAEPVGSTGLGAIEGLAYDASNGFLYGLTGPPDPPTLVRLDLETGAATIVGETLFGSGKSLAFDPAGDLFAGGLVPDLGRLVTALFAVDPASGRASRRGLPRAFYEALAFVPTGPSREHFAIPLAAREWLLVTTSTPLGGRGIATNVLDPQLRLFAPDGSLVARDDDGAGDGRNASLRFETSADGAGTYVLELAPSDTDPDAHGGEYLLSIEARVHPGRGRGGRHRHRRERDEREGREGREGRD